MPSLLDAPVSDADAIVGPGSAAAALSITTTSGPDTVEVLPAGSTPTATSVCDTPLAEPDSGLVNVVVQPPLLSATAEPTDTVVPPVTSISVTTSPALAVPLIVTRLSLVRPSLGVPAVCRPNVSSTSFRFAGAGSLVSIVTSAAPLNADVLPAMSIWRAVIWCVPSAITPEWIV
ncbi:Uncharacterised protein [Burkholderia pseudomallei]|nr:Uncharacterised protein [Burkholderia pseudomallei]